MLEERFADREHHLLVESMKGREPRQLGGDEIFAGDDGLDAGIANAAVLSMLLMRACGYGL